MVSILTVIHVVACVVIVLFVLLQSGRDAGSLLGGGGADSVFGGAGPASFLVKVTAGTGALFFVTSVLLTALDTTDRGSLVDRIDMAEATQEQKQAVAPKAPATVQGSISDKNNNQGIAAWIAINPGSAKVAAAVDGSFSIPVSDPDSHAMVVTATGYLPTIQNLKLSSGEAKEVAISLQATKQEIDIANGQLKVEPVYFGSDNAEIKAESTKTLTAVKDFMQINSSSKLAIFGHTDNKGDAEASLKLSQDRAEAVAKFLTEQGIATDRLRATGFGGERPIADNGSNEGRLRNSRIEFILE